MDPIHYHIHDLSWDARGVARHPGGRVVMISGTLPGDTVTATLSPGGSSGPLFGRVKEIITASPDRIPHPCDYHHALCPATPLGSWRYECALDWKRRHLIETLRRIGAVEDPEVAEAIPSPKKWEYRDRLELHLYNDQGHWTLGYCTPEGYSAVRDCLLGSPPLRRGMASLADTLESLSVYPKALPRQSDRCSGPDAVRALVRDNGRGQTVAVLFVQNPGKIDLIVLAQALADSHLVGWQIRHAPSSRSRFFASQLIDKRGDPQVFHLIDGDKEVVADPTVFSQVNRPAAALLVEKVLESISDSAGLLDLYGGYGAFALGYALRRGGHAAVVEASVLAVKAGQAFARDHDLPVEFINADLGKSRLPMTNLKKYDVIILDPPRAGAHPELIQELNAQGPQRLLYVSCHPAVLARDLKRLTSYRARTFIPVDLFPQTPDLETITILDRN